jgi:hypothetical protein
MILFSGGFRMGRRSPSLFMPKIYHLMLVQLNIWGAKYLKKKFIFFLLFRWVGPPIWSAPFFLKISWSTTVVTLSNSLKMKKKKSDCFFCFSKYKTGRMSLNHANLFLSEVSVTMFFMSFGTLIGLIVLPGKFARITLWVIWLMFLNIWEF